MTLRVEPRRDAAIARIAERQHGVVSLIQLRALGLGSSGVRMRVARGALHRVHRSVYAVGYPSLTRHGRWMAAVFACGPRAVLSHRAAAALHGLRPDNRVITDVSLPSKSIRQRSGVEVHAAKSLRNEDITSADRIPCTTVPRTVIDLADVVSRREVERAIDRAETLRIFDRAAVEATAGQAIGRRGAAVVRAVLAQYPGPTVTDSELEERFLALCDESGIRRPEVGPWLALEGGHVKVDFLWRTERLVVETDGHAFHKTRRAFEGDRRRDQRLLLAGHRVVRFTWRQIVGRPGEVAATIRELLG